MSLHVQLDLKPHEAASIIPHRPILLGYRGSVAHGMYVPPTEPTGIDDVDLMGVFIPRLDFYFGSDSQKDTHERMVKHYDCVSYEVRKYVSLLEKCNPNVLSLLWLKSWLILEPEGEMLVANRSLFASKRAYHSFSGYAYGQLKRMESFKDVHEQPCECSGQFHEPGCELAQERGRGSSKRFATGFMGAKRKSLVAQFGYDVKNAAHLIRLLLMGLEFLQTGALTVDRRDAWDADMLLEIKRGQWQLRDVKRYAENLFDQMKAASRTSTLPDEPNGQKINDLLMDILCRAHAGTATLWNHYKLMPSTYQADPPSRHSEPQPTRTDFDPPEDRFGSGTSRNPGAT